MQEEEKKMLKIYKGDITALSVDIVVNAANKTLLGGGGVDGAIHRKAGKQLLEECKKLNGCNTGDAKMTNAYNMLCDKIIHTVGPIYKDGLHDEDKLLRNCYKNSMELAQEYQKSSRKEKISIAFPCISTGVYHFPSEKAAKIAVDVAKKYDNNSIDIIFVCFLEKDYDIYRNLLNL